ncbi:MAG: hypothetical protein GYB64_00835 [Chloroflexi bacterium]|nr:hypothetical protein [Chloroflexota bacterium]
MTASPTFVFSMLLATFIGALGHLILGGDGRKLLVYILASWLGIAVGEGIGDLLALNGFAIGTINTLGGVLGAIAAVAAAAVLAADGGSGA